MLGLLLLVVAKASGQRDSLSSLQNNIPGEPNVDYPIYTIPPVTGFECNGRTNGYYADTLSGCQSFHYCGHSSSVFGNIKYTSLCPNGTVFNQELFICDWWYRVDCGLAESFYRLNDNIEAFADVTDQEIEKPFLQSYLEDDQDRSSYDLTAKDPIVRKNGGSFTRASSSSNRVKSAGLFKTSTKLNKFPNFDLVNLVKRKSRSEGVPLDEAYGVYGLAADEEVDLTGSLSWGSRRGKRNKVEGGKVKQQQWNDLRATDDEKTAQDQKIPVEKPMRQKKIRFLD